MLYLLLPSHVYGQSRTIDVNETFEVKSLLVPYAFYNDHFDLAGGTAFGIVGHPQEQMSLVGSVIGSTNSSWAMYLLGKDIQMPFDERIFLDPWLSIGGFEDLRAYRDGNPKYPLERAGSHNSHEDNYLQGKGDDGFVRLNFKYLLAMGHGEDTVINTCVVDRGILVSGQTGGDHWNPFTSGRTYVEVEPFYRRQNIEADYASDALSTNGVKFSLFHDNTDFAPNPSKGSSQRFTLTRDWGLFDSSEPWTVAEAEFSKYFSLGSTNKLRQQVLAFNLWIANTLTWDRTGIENGKIMYSRPPDFAGASLGGLFRMRGFDSSRFSDQAAIYYTTEYRVIPEWNPFDDWAWAKNLEVSWVQGVLFAEAGRVAERWTVNRLHSDMHWDVGVGLRAMAKSLVLRIDLAVCDEGPGVRMMVGQPF
jgi:hypothetical protein